MLSNVNCLELNQACFSGWINYQQQGWGITWVGQSGGKRGGKKEMSEVGHWMLYFPASATIFLQGGVHWKIPSSWSKRMRAGECPDECSHGISQWGKGRFPAPRILLIPKCFPSTLPGSQGMGYRALGIWFSLSWLKLAMSTLLRSLALNESHLFIHSTRIYMIIGYTALGN